MNAMADEQTIICTGCESACEVVVGLRASQSVVLGGNNCPTGAAFALAQVSSNNKTKQDRN